MKIGTYYLPTCNIRIIEFWCTFFPRFWIPAIILSVIMSGSRQIVISYFWMLSLFWCLTFHFKTVCQLGAKFMTHRGFFHDTQWTMSTQSPPKLHLKRSKQRSALSDNAIWTKTKKVSGCNDSDIYILIQLHDWTQ